MGPTCGDTTSFSNINGSYQFDVNTNQTTDGPQTTIQNTAGSEQATTLSNTQAVDDSTTSITNVETSGVFDESTTSTVIIKTSGVFEASGSFNPYNIQQMAVICFCLCTVYFV